MIEAMPPTRTRSVGLGSWSVRVYVAAAAQAAGEHFDGRELRLGPRQAGGRHLDGERPGEVVRLGDVVEDRRDGPAQVLGPAPIGDGGLGDLVQSRSRNASKAAIRPCCLVAK